MNATETGRLLAKRAQLTRVGYVTDTVNAWTEALADIDYPDAERAILALVETGETNITVPAIRKQLRGEHPPPEPTPSPERDPGCSCQPVTREFPAGHLCEMHRRIGLAGIEHVRAQLRRNQ